MHKYNLAGRGESPTPIDIPAAAFVPIAEDIVATLLASIAPFTTALRKQAGNNISGQGGKKEDR